MDMCQNRYAFLIDKIRFLPLYKVQVIILIFNNLCHLLQFRELVSYNEQSHGHNKCLHVLEFTVS